MLVSLYAENKCRNLEIYKIKDYEDMNEIVKYNEIDCKVMGYFTIFKIKMEKLNI